MALPTPEEQEAYDKLSPEEKAKLAKEVEEKAKAELKKQAKFGIPFIAVGLVVIIGGCAAILNQEYEPKRNPNLEGTVQDFDVCVKKQKRAGLSTDKCWDML